MQEVEKFDPRTVLSPPMIEGKQTFGTVTDTISDVALGTFEGRVPWWWIIGFGLSFMLAQLLLMTVTYLLYMGIGIWGNNQPVGWAFDIINFVWWIGIGHAGTLISAILLLMRQQWRTSINRFAEAMTLFAVACAGLFPLLHTGRPWLAYWLLPYPNTMNMWPNFKSPLEWDVFAVSTYASVSALFWFVGLIPDLATLRDRARNPLIKFVYGAAALGWRGSARHWHRYETAYLILAGLSTPLVLSVHTIVSFDFAVAQVPGWHATIFPPYFVAGAVYAGFAMVLILSIPLRILIPGLKDVITKTHLIYMGKVMMATGLIVCYGYAMEAFFAWYSGSFYEMFMITNRALTGPYWWSYWLLILCNGLSIQFMWFKRIRESALGLFIISIVVSVGMWLERFVIIVTSLNRDFLPSSWATYSPSIFDWTMFLGTIGMFFTMLFLFIRFLPVVSIFEVRTLLPQAKIDGTTAEHQDALETAHS